MQYYTIIYNIECNINTVYTYTYVYIYIIYINIHIHNNVCRYIITRICIYIYMYAHMLQYQLLSSYHDIIRLSQIKSVKVRKHPPGPSTEDARGREPASPRARAAEDGHAAAHDGCTHDGRTHGSHDGRQGDANGTQRQGIMQRISLKFRLWWSLFGGDVSNVPYMWSVWGACC